LDEFTLSSALEALPGTTGSADTPVSQLLVDSGLVSSLGEARRAIAQGGVYLNNAKVDDDTAVLGTDLLVGGLAVLRRGKKTLAGVRLSA
jgi:tyrosyl-tRNA synthetase